MKFNRFVDLSIPIRWILEAKKREATPTFADRGALIRIQKWSSTDPNTGSGDLFSEDILKLYKETRIKMVHCSNPGDASDLLTSTCKHILRQATEADWDRLIAPYISNHPFIDNPAEWRALWDEVRSDPEQAEV